MTLLPHFDTLPEAARNYEKSSFKCNTTMPAITFISSLYILFKLVTVNCYTYHTKPLFLSSSDVEDLVWIITAGGDHKVKTFVVTCHEDSIEVVIKAYLFDPALPVEPTHFRLGPVRAAQDHCRASESANGEYVIRASPSDCGSQVMVGEPLNDECQLQSKLMLIKK